MKHKLFLLYVFLLSIGITFSTVTAKNYDVDTGFRPNADGFGFENYGGQVCSNFWSCDPVQNLTSVEMRRMFGDQVCKKINADGSCTLLKVAKSWMDEVNRTMSGGHCEGMAVLSTLFYDGIKKPADFGAKKVYNLQLENNSPLQRELAYWFATQWFMDGHLIEEDPNTQLKTLIKWFKNDPNRTVPVGVFKKNLTGGHAITAYAIEERGNGIYWIMVYDNNYPDEERYITVDTNKNSWSYSGATMAGLQQDIYDGKGNKNPFQLSPVDSRLGKFDCDFCPASSSEDSGASSPDSIPDVSIPWINPDVETPDEDSSSSDSIYDIFGPWLFPDDQDSSKSPDDSESSSSIYDLLMPWLFPDASQPAEETERKPSQIPSSTPKPIPSTPTPNPENNADTVNFNKIYVDKDINIYVETDADQKAGYDWESDTKYDSIPGVTVSRSVYRSSALLPTNLKYYLWINSPEERNNQTVFDAEITSPGTVLQLRNVLESYKEPNFVYNPPVHRKNNDVEYEAFEIMSDPAHLPEIEFTISDKNGEYNLKFFTTFDGDEKIQEPIDFVIFHDYDYSQVGIWITAANEKNTSKFKNAKFQVKGEFYLWDETMERYVATNKYPIKMGIDGMFFFNYKNWLDGDGYFFTGDLDGDSEFETWKEIGKKL